MEASTRSWVARACLSAIAALGLGTVGCAKAAELTLMVEPTYTPDQAQQVYKPLADYLTKATGHQIKLVAPRNYHFFWRDVRQNTPVDLMFAEAHITDYRTQRFQTVPLVRTAERTSYTLVVSSDSDIADLKSLIGKTIITMPSPSLGFALLLELFPNPVSQPNILSSAASWRDGVEIVFAGEADAAIVPTWLKDQYPNSVPLQETRSFPGAAISASPSLDPAIRDQVRQALLKLHEDASAYDVLNELGVSKFEETNSAEYSGAETMLKEFFGYR
jgi:ABC-type phosphate/phosphonate transport system substrate-binding protein